MQDASPTLILVERVYLPPVELLQLARDSHPCFLHSVQVGKPGLVCDLQGLYRYLMDDFVVGFSQGLNKRDFTVKAESVARKRKGKREYLNDVETGRMMGELEDFFRLKVDIPLIRHGNRQRIETLINEEALLLEKYLRDERKEWTPRIAAV